MDVGGSHGFVVKNLGNAVDIAKELPHLVHAVLVSLHQPYIR